MGAIWTGGTIAKSKVEFGYDPNTGPFTDVEYQGSVVAMDTLVSTEAAKGVVVRQSQDGPVKTCTIRYNNWYENESDDTYTEQWTHTHEIIEKEIWAAPWVQEAMKSTDDGGSCPSPADFRKTIEDAVDDGDSFATLLETFRAKGSAWDFVSSVLTFDGRTYAAPYALIYRELVRGATHWTTEANVVRRVRTSGLGFQWYATILSTKWIYPNSAITSMPSSIWAEIIPPQQEPYAYVGWRMRAREYEISGDRRSETVEIVLAAWSTNNYTVWTGGPIM